MVSICIFLVIGVSVGYIIQTQKHGANSVEKLVDKLETSIIL